MATFRIPFDGLMEVEADTREEAVEKAGQVIEQLPIKMGGVLGKYKVTRHDILPRFQAIERVEPSGG